jgi:hypothetical protein
VVCLPWSCRLAGGSANPKILASRTSHPPVLPVKKSGRRKKTDVAVNGVSRRR